MDIDYFEKTWSRKKTDSTASQVFWDSRAEEFNKKVYTGEGEERLYKILSLLCSKGMLTDESSVLDIGCGPGKYSVEFAKRSKTVTGIDISKRMIECAKENAIQEGILNTEFKIADWEDTDIMSAEWYKKYDLVFASMCPAINSRATLEKMIMASRGYCFLSSFVERTDEIKDHLSKCIVWHNSKGGYGKTIYSSFNLLWLMGFYPEILYIDTAWEHTMPIAKAESFYCANFEVTQKITEEQRAFIRSYLESISEDGVVKERVKAKIAWMTWKVK